MVRMRARRFECGMPRERLVFIASLRATTSTRTAAVWSTPHILITAACRVDSRLLVCDCRIAVTGVVTIAAAAAAAAAAVCGVRCAVHGCWRSKLLPAG